MGAYDKALEYYTQSLEIKKTLGDLRALLPLRKLTEVRYRNFKVIIGMQNVLT